MRKVKLTLFKIYRKEVIFLKIAKQLKHNNKTMSKSLTNTLKKFIIDMTILK